MTGPVPRGAGGGPGGHAEVVLIHGDERFLVDRAARAWLAQARAASVTELDVEVLDAPPRAATVRDSLREVPFLAESRHVLLRDPPQLGERVRRGADGLDALVEAIAQRSPQTALCVVAHMRVPAQNPLLILIRAEGRIAEYVRPRGRDRRAAAETLMREHHLRLPRPALELLTRLTGNELGVLDAELAKLASFAAGSGRQPTLDDVRQLGAGREQLEAWDVVDRLLAVPHARGAAALEALLADGVSPQQLIAVLGRQLREILQVQHILESRPGAGAAALAAELGVPPWQAERLARWASVVPAGRAESWLRALQQLDARTKLGLGDDTAGLRSLALSAARDLGAGRPGPR